MFNEIHINIIIWINLADELLLHHGCSPMKILKLIVALSSVLIANAIYAADASVTAASWTTTGNGGGAIYVVGSNGTFHMTKATNAGTLASYTSVTHVTSVAIDCGSYNGSTGDYSSCTLVIPEGATGTIECQAALSGSSSGSAYCTVNSTTYYASTSTSIDTTYTLSPGTYNLSVHSSNPSTIGGPHAVISVAITYE